MFYNLDPLDFHQLYKFCKFQMPFKALGKIVVQGLKQTFKFVNHLQVSHSLNYHIGYMKHTMNPHRMWSPTINNMLGNI
jgi:hypothetical protein